MVPWVSLSNLEQTSENSFSSYEYNSKEMSNSGLFIYSRPHLIISPPAVMFLSLTLSFSQIHSLKLCNQAGSFPEWQCQTSNHVNASRNSMGLKKLKHGHKDEKPLQLLLNPVFVCVLSDSTLYTCISIISQIPLNPKINLFINHDNPFWDRANITIFPSKILSYQFNLQK